MAMTPSTASILARSDEARRHRRGGDEVGRVLAGDREPGEAAGELPGGHDQHRHQELQRAVARVEAAPQQSGPAGPDRASASASATPATDRAAAASIPCGAARARGEVLRNAAGRRAWRDAANCRRPPPRPRIRRSAGRRSRWRRRAARGSRRARRRARAPSPSTARAGHHSDAVDVGRKREHGVRLQHSDARERAVGQDRRDLQADDEGGADHGGDDLRHKPRALRRR